MAHQPESEFDRHRQLVYGKLKDKSLDDVDFAELAEAVYGRQYSSDVARRMMYGSCKTLELMDKCSAEMSSDSVMNDINARMIELQKERQKFFDQRREFNKLVSAAGREEHLHDVIIKAASDLEHTVGPILFDKCDCGSIRNSDTEAIVVFSDWHYGMKTDNVFNSFNTDICRKRIDKVVDDARKRIMLHGCKRLHVVVLGDLFHGSIHVSARVASEELVCDQIIQASELLARAIGELNSCVDETIVHMTYGNHARTIQSKADSIHSDNLEKLIPWWLEQRFKGDPTITVSCDSDNEFVLFSSCGHDFCATHGDLDSVRSSTKLIPALLQRKYGLNIEYILLGDKHHRESFEELGVTSMLCGSLCGTDDYANDKRLYSNPSQMLLIVNEGDGVDAEYRLRC